MAKLIHQKFKELNFKLIENYDDAKRYSNKPNINKEPKKSTVQVTYELWLEKKSILEIALIRKYTTDTILGHLTKLIQAQTIVIQDVLPGDKIIDLEKAFYGYKEESVLPLKELHGDKFSWEELRMYKASLNLN